MSKKYRGSCYIGVVGGEMENGQCRDSISAIIKRDMDIGPRFIRATKGYDARQMHLNNWYDGTKKPFLLLLDHDMLYPVDTLVRLRKHAIPYVSGLYMRRRYSPIAPVWFNNNQAGHWPFSPMTSIPEQNMLYEIGASGWGCILIHRDVVTAVRGILKGEPEIIEDDMDVFPYDLKKIIRAISVLSLPEDKLTFAKVSKAAKVLSEEFRPLRGVKDTVGSDIRFPFYAKLAGYQLYGDGGVECLHNINYPITPNDYASQTGAVIRDISIAIQKEFQKESERLRKALQ